MVIIAALATAVMSHSSALPFKGPSRASLSTGTSFLGIGLPNAVFHCLSRGRAPRWKNGFKERECTKKKESLRPLLGHIAIGPGAVGGGAFVNVVGWAQRFWWGLRLGWVQLPRSCSPFLVAFSHRG